MRLVRRSAPNSLKMAALKWLWTVKIMTPVLCAIFLLCLSSLAIAANFTQVYEWPDKLDYEWPSEENRTKTFKPEDIFPRNVAVYESRIFLSLDTYGNDIPATLVSLPTSSESFEPPKLTAFPSWDIHGKGHCNKIEKASGLEIDSVGRLWVLDSGSDTCKKSKLWTVNLSNRDQTKLIHQFPFQKSMNDLAIDETPDGTLAYISRWDEPNIVVFSLEKNTSWVVVTPGIIKAYSIALSPQEEPRQLYLSYWNSTDLFSISVTTLRNRTLTAKPKFIRKCTATYLCRMVMDNQGIMYTSYLKKNFINSWNSSQPFEEQRFLEFAGLMNIVRTFTFALDQNGMLWITVFDADRKPRFRLLKAAVGSKSSKASPERPSFFHQYRLYIIILICFIVLCVVLSSLIILWRILRKKRTNSLPPNTNEALQMSVFCDNQEVQDDDSRPSSVAASCDDIGSAEGLYAEVIHDQVAATPPSPDLYERPIILSPRSARRVKALPERPRSFEKFGDAPRAPVQLVDVGPAQPENLYDDVAPETSRTTRCECTSSESAQYLQLFP
ncbi:protein yellow-like isoform X2 [Cloeon dipterum]|uniref:protein yellow-like isoform X2 n=1 Tax=Cloeon dipterum TaxID=197152 RepID=UPI00321F9A2E